MSSLIVFHQSTPQVPNKLLTHVEDITSTLAAAGIKFAEVPVQKRVSPGEPEEALLVSSQAQLEQLQAAHGMASAQVLSVCDERAEGSPLADSLRVEQRCAARQVVYALAGRCQLMLNLGEFIYGVVLEKQGLVVVPANTPFWLDGGENPRFALARLFETEQVPAFEVVEGDLAGRFFRFDQF
jgi:1,2-dihydroxy-3-keto-5-methylthiopentene dioxygenase